MNDLIINGKYNMSLLSRFRGVPDVGSVPFHRHSPEGLAARWAQWGASTKTERSPIADLTGEYAGVEQPYDIWFLAGSFGGSVRRSCTIPANKKIFFPVFNIWLEEGHPTVDLSKIFGYLKINGEEVELDSIYTNKPFLLMSVFSFHIFHVILEYLDFVFHEMG